MAYCVYRTTMVARKRSLVKERSCEAFRVVQKCKSTRNAGSCEEKLVLFFFPFFFLLFANEAPYSRSVAPECNSVDAHRKAPSGTPFPSTSPQLWYKDKSHGTYLAVFFFFLLPTIDVGKARRVVRHSTYLSTGFV